jgi:hypothetical protein
MSRLFRVGSAVVFRVGDHEQLHVPDGRGGINVLSERIYDARTEPTSKQPDMGCKSVQGNALASYSIDEKTVQV